MNNSLTKKQIEDVNEDLEQLYHLGTIWTMENEGREEENPIQTLEHIIQMCQDMVVKVQGIIDTLPKCECCGKPEWECAQEQQDIAERNEWEGN